MFCGNCGKTNNASHKFCAECGTSIEKTTEKTKSFAQFYKEKGSERVSHFHVKKKRVKENEDISIFISVLRQSDGQLRQISGSRIPLNNVKPQWNHVELKRASYEKLKRYNNIIATKTYEEVKLVYRSGENCRYLPGTTTPFTLEAYKNDLGVKYRAIVLYLQAYGDNMEDSDSSDNDLPIAPIHGKRYIYIYA